MCLVVLLQILRLRTSDSLDQHRPCSSVRTGFNVVIAQYCHYNFYYYNYHYNYYYYNYMCLVVLLQKLRLRTSDSLDQHRPCSSVRTGFNVVIAQYCHYNYYYYNYHYNYYYYNYMCLVVLLQILRLRTSDSLDQHRPCSGVTTGFNAIVIGQQCAEINTTERAYSVTQITSHHGHQSATHNLGQSCNTDHTLHMTPWAPISYSQSRSVLWHRWYTSHHTMGTNQLLTIQVSPVTQITHHRSIYKYLDTGLPSLSIDKMRAPQTHLSCPACITLTHVRQPNLSSAPQTSRARAHAPPWE